MCSRSDQRPTTWMVNSLDGLHCNLCPLIDGQGQSKLLCPRSLVPGLDGFERLQQPHDRVASFCQSILLANTDSRTAIERQIFLSQVRDIISKSRGQSRWLTQCGRMVSHLSGLNSSASSPYISLLLCTPIIVYMTCSPFAMNSGDLPSSPPPRGRTVS